MRFTEEWILAEARRQYDEGQADIGVKPGGEIAAAVRASI